MNAENKEKELQLEIDQMAEGEDKKRRQAALDHKKRMRQIDEQEKQLLDKKIQNAKQDYDNDPNNKKKEGFFAQGLHKGITLTEDERIGVDAERKSEEVKWQKQREEWREEDVRKDKETMYQYLANYGDYAQKRLALEQQHQMKLEELRKKEATQWEIMSAEREHQTALTKLDREQADKAVDWEGIFGNLTLYTAEELEAFKTQLREKLTEQGLSTEEYKTIVERISTVNDAIIDAQDKENTFLGMSIARGKERRKLDMEHKEALRQQELAQKALNDAENQHKHAQMEVNDLMEKYHYGGDPSEFLNFFEPDSEAYIEVEEALRRLSNTTDKLNQAQENNTTATNNEKNAKKKLEIFSSDFNKALEEAMPTIQQFAANLQSIPELLGALGIDENSSLGKAASGIAAATNSGMGAVQDYMSGNYVGAAAKALDTLASVGDTLGSIGVGGFGSSDRNLERDIENLTASNEALRHSIDGLSEAMDDSTVAEAPELYKEMVDNINKTMANTQEMMARSAAAYSDGFAGIGGHHSSQHKINNAMSASEWQRVSRIVGQTVRSGNDFFNLSSKQMSYVATYAPEIYAKIKQLADDGYKDAAQFMDDYIGQWKELEEAEERYAEKLTSTTFDSVYDGFLSSLSDMDKSAYDFAQDFEKYMFDAMLNAQIGDLYKDKLKKWYDRFKSSMESDGLDEREIADLREEYKAMAEEAVKTRDELSRLTGYGSSSEGSATFNAAKSFSLEQGDILNGRLAMIQQGQRENIVIAQQMLASLQQMEALSSVSSSTNTAVTEIRNMMIMTNSYLEDVARYAKSTYKDFGQKLDTIVYNLSNKL